MSSPPKDWAQLPQGMSLQIDSSHPSQQGMAANSTTAHSLLPAQQQLLHVWLRGPDKPFLPFCPHLSGPHPQQCLGGGTRERGHSLSPARSGARRPWHKGPLMPPTTPTMASKRGQEKAEPPSPESQSHAIPRAMPFSKCF